MWTTKNYNKSDKIFRGAYNYYRNDNIYAEETFDVYFEKKENSYITVAESLARVATGEMLSIKVEYVVNKEYIPTFVSIEKNMGKEFAKEVFKYVTKRNHIVYTFDNSEGFHHEEEIITAPRYHIATPLASPSMLFLKSKKLDVSGKNSFNVLSTLNQWDFKDSPVFKNIIVERANLTTEKMNIDGQNVQATQYKLYDGEADFKNVKEPPHIRIFLSQHGAIPYVLRADDGTKIQIKYFNNLNKDE